MAVNENVKMCVPSTVSSPSTLVSPTVWKEITGAVVSLTNTFRVWEEVNTSAPNNAGLSPLSSTK